MKIFNQSRNILLAGEAAIAGTFFKRAVGLLGKSEFKKGTALVLRPANSIHTFFMRFPIDVLFIDKEDKVIKAISCLKPWRITVASFATVMTIELPCGTLQEIPTTEGDILKFI